MNREQLIDLARSVRSHAHAPYSGFAVGAALLAADGQAFAGCNVENISFGLTMCAERVAIGSALSAGVTSFDLLAIVSHSKEPVMPCGACRQVLAEFNPSLLILSSNLDGDIVEVQLDNLLPSPRQGMLDRSM